MDTLGKTVTEYALERKIAELTRENYLLRRESSNYKYCDPATKPQDLELITVEDKTYTLRRVVSGTVSESPYGGHQILARSSGGLGYSYFMTDEMWARANAYVRADMLQHIFQLMARACADKLSGEPA